ncbi:MAG TPA: hypothetical protein VH724_11335, partial [Candidatus Angelobacter sp.]|nr:hypothetical protein [Candidatus Angelobacter sp.]
NNSGEIVGRFTLADGSVQGFIFHNGSFSNIAPIANQTGQSVNGVNDTGEISGLLQLSNSQPGFTATCQ